jgi:uncharacterized protein YcnI
VKFRTIPIAAAVAAALTLAPAAAAHVTLNPGEWEAGGFARFAVRVPNERDAAATTRVTLKFPEQILSASFQPIEGWRREVKMGRLDEPIDDEGEQITERIDTVTWSGGRIRPGEFQEFGVSFQVPDEPVRRWRSLPCSATRTARSSAGSDRRSRTSRRRSSPSSSRRRRKLRRRWRHPRRRLRSLPAVARSPEEGGGSDALSIVALSRGRARGRAGGARPEPPAIRGRRPHGARHALTGNG